MRKRPSSRSENSGGDIWVGGTDLMASILFLFLVILGSFSVRFTTARDKLIESRRRLESPLLTRQKMLDELKILLERESIAVEVDPTEGILRVSEKTLAFEPARAVPTEATLPHVGALARVLAEVAGCFSQNKSPATQLHVNKPAWCLGAVTTPTSAYLCPKGNGRIDTIMIEGHTDAATVRARTGYLDNLALSTARAATVLRLLKICDQRLDLLFNPRDNPLLGVSGYADLRPVIKDDPLDARNRRIDIRFVMHMSEGEKASSL